MPEISPVTIAIGGLRITTVESTAQAIIRDPARLLEVYEMMLEVAYRQEMPDVPCPFANRIRRMLDGP